LVAWVEAAVAVVGLVVSGAVVAAGCDVTDVVSDDTRDDVTGAGEDALTKVTVPLGVATAWWTLGAACGGRLTRTTCGRENFGDGAANRAGRSATVASAPTTADWLARRRSVELFSAIPQAPPPSATAAAATSERRARDRDAAVGR
jgi:hypothetical protein